MPEDTEQRLPNRRPAGRGRLTIQSQLNVTRFLLGGALNGPTKAPYFSDYVTPNLPPAPPAVDHSQNRHQWGMMGNDKFGDCAVAAAGHMIQEWTSLISHDVQIPDDEIIRVYRILDPSLNMGVTAGSVFNYWHDQGIGGHKIEGSTWVGLNQTHIKDCIYLFGNCYIVINLPASAKTQLDNNQQTWEVPPEGMVGAGTPGSWSPPDNEGKLRAYHMVPMIGYDDAVTEVITWGLLQRMSWNFFNAYGLEAWGVLSTDWIDAKGVSGSGFDLAALREDLKEITA
jgi:hypothetical protein